MFRIFRKAAGVLAVFIAAILLLSSCVERPSGIPEIPGGSTDSPGKAGKFNEGIVDYVVEKTESYVGAFPEDKLGEIVKSGDVGVEVIFDADFEDGDASCGGDATMQSTDSAGVTGGRLYVPAFDENAEGHGWTTWAPSVECFSADNYGAQISFDCEISSDGGSPWMAPFFGIFKESLTSIADNASGGLYISANSVSGTLTVFCGNHDTWSWPSGNVTVKLGKDALAGPLHVDIITVGRELVRMFLNGSKVLEMTFDSGTGKYEVTGGDGKRCGKGKFDPELLEGEFFQIFTHLGIIGVDNLTILGFSKGTKKVDTEIKAVPKDGYSLGLDITDKQDVVSICYSVWHNAINGSGTGPIKNISDVTEMLKTHDFTAEKGFVNKETGETSNALTKFHYWGKPAQGYYRSSDVSAIRNNMTLIYNAGVDFLIIDLTFATAPGYAPGSSPWESYINSSVTPLLDTIMQMRSEGLGTPYVVFWMGNDSMFEHMDEHFLSVEKWKDCFVYWNGKPFMMKWTMDQNESYEKWTVRGMYGLQGRADVNQWSYLEIDNSRTVAKDKDGKPEHMCADVATQETYMSVSTAHGRNGGQFFYGQWKNVFAVHPKIVTVTWWNEWCAQLYYVEGVGFIFTDNFNEEYSRDIEPQDGKNGDTYYKWLCKYIAAYRSGGDCPKLTSN